MKNDAARAAAVGRIDRDAGRCAAVNAKNRGKGKAKGHAKRLTACLKAAV